ncbi:MAG: tetratricopeptide repeat protein [Vicinamibacteraceae bacterium]
MKAESIVFAVAGACFGLLVGWLLGAQSVPASRPEPTEASAPAAAGGGGGAAAEARSPAPLDEAKLEELMALAEARPTDAAVRAEIGNLYFDAERFDEAARWYEASTEIDSSDPDVTTDLGVSYYYTNQPDRALAQFAKSLDIDPRHTKTLLNLGIVRAFAKQDLKGAAEAWQQVVKLAPDSPEGRAARTALDALRSAHPELGGERAPTSP